MRSDGLIIIGGSYAAMGIAQAAREAEYRGPIRMLTDEDRLPYHRPPLSKGYLKGTASEDELPLRSDAFYEENGIEVSFGTRVSRIDRIDRSVETEGGERIPYDYLALAVGTRPRHLAVPGCEAEGIHYLKSFADSERIKAELERVESAVVIGGGFIGLEAASALAMMGRKVTVIEALDRLVARAATPILSGFIERVHGEHGVEVLLSRTVQSFEVENGRVTGVIDNRGARHPAQLVVVGIGVVPNDALARGCGLLCNNGIEVDEHGLTSDPFIYAGGDCTSFTSRFYDGGPLRLECVQNATDQSRVVGAAIAGDRRPYEAVPWFWSDQYEHKIQMAGISLGYDRAVERGDIGGSKFSVLYYKGGRLISADSVNRPAEHIQLRKVLAAGVSPTPEEAADESVELRKALDAARSGR